MSPQESSRQSGILVIGAGELGSNVVQALSHHRDAGPVTVLLRPSSTPQGTRLRADLADRGVTVAEADVATAPVDELAELLRPFSTVVSCIGFAAGPGTQRKLTHAVLQAGVPRYLPWQFGVDYDVIGRGSPQDLFDEQLDVRDLLRAQTATEWVIVSTGMFTSFLFDPGFGVVDAANHTVNALGSWDTEVTVTTAEDIGTLTAEIIQSRPRIVNQVVYVAGDTISYRELADVVERVGGIPVTRNLWTVPYLLGDVDRDPHDGMSKYRAVFARGIGVSWPKSDSYNVTHGIPTLTAEQWARGRLVSATSDGRWI
ncbi:aromatic alcohol reductase [Mycobacterium yunnanensis]|uniref:Aromatic alcohol reductase n=1 Tax=Mycobacterium yunnanensis TaxID=368477 RepID=A0A9X2Z4S3_9MYCO|nr:aromatic alcohol reductase [Mycobacterium yunnanensis]MCV7423505.1 aromatic alcohol reductase [Mycobacterium yunnanensis]